jgi:hypothetical protein
MRVFIVAYCFGANSGQALIGVYKRGIRIGLELSERGHVVTFHCPGHENYRDEMTDEAKRTFAFVDWPLKPALHEGASWNREQTHQALKDARPDMVVIGEAPLAGALLEVTLCAAELGIPVICVDNTYNGLAVDHFCQRHGPIFDGLVLAGPKAFHTGTPPPYLLQVAPFIDAEGALAALEPGGLGTLPWTTSGRRLMTVLAYDFKVEMLGRSIFQKLDRPDVDAVFLTPDREGCSARLGALPESLRARTQVMAPLGDAEHFGLLTQSNLVIGKSGFMQVTECLSLHTPIIVYYFGDFHLGLMPEVCAAFTHATADTDADAATMERARHLIDLSPTDMISIHDGEFGSARRTVDFMEQLIAAPPVRDFTQECAELGLTRARIESALASADANAQLLWCRMTEIRQYGGQSVSSVVVRVTRDGHDESRRMWFRRFGNADAVDAELDLARVPEARRSVWYSSRDGLALIEDDIGEDGLPRSETA